ncbi:chromosomal replication initiator DnaA [Thalassococcus arenae]|uniref:chromosomal replication initiator DnaA n=1 Tax=Thalassococcus arenae TaxID=2851652 RepID=UPI0032AE968E
MSPANAMAVAMIDTCDSWSGGKLLLIGPEGAGKTHLAHVWAAETRAKVVSARDLDKADIPALAEGPVCIEDLDEIAGDATREQQAFHLHNLTLANRHALLVTAAMPPARWGLALPDLQSRMEGTQSVTLGPPDDALLAALLAKLFADRQIVPARAVIPYLVRHMRRSFDTAARVVAALDAAALSARKPVTQPLAAAALAEIHAGFDETPRDMSLKSCRD